MGRQLRVSLLVLIAMLVFRAYRCDFGHEWTVQCEEDAPERPEDTHCFAGHEAVTRRVEEPVDEVQVVIRPAARIVDRVRQQVAGAGTYRLVLLDRTGKELVHSDMAYSLESVSSLARLFAGKAPSAALALWARRFKRNDLPNE
jgi:hypothetical protein